MKTGYKVCDAMTEQPLMVDKNVSLVECSKIMADNRVGSLLINDKNKLFIITEFDIVRKAVAQAMDMKKTKVADVMSRIEYVIEPEKDIFEALQMMKDFNLRHLPVVDKDQMVGLLTQKDILKIEPQLFDLLVDKIELREEERKPTKQAREKEGVCNICGNYAINLTEKDGVLVCDECAKEE